MSLYQHMSFLLPEGNYIVDLVFEKGNIIKDPPKSCNANVSSECIALRRI